MRERQTARISTGPRESEIAEATRTYLEVEARHPTWAPDRVREALFGRVIDRRSAAAVKVAIARLQRRRAFGDAVFRTEVRVRARLLAAAIQRHCHYRPPERGHPGGPGYYRALQNWHDRLGTVPVINTTL